MSEKTGFKKLHLTLFQKLDFRISAISRLPFTYYRVSDVLHFTFSGHLDFTKVRHCDYVSLRLLQHFFIFSWPRITENLIFARNKKANLEKV